MKSIKLAIATIALVCGTGVQAHTDVRVVIGGTPGYYATYPAVAPVIQYYENDYDREYRERRERAEYLRSRHEQEWRHQQYKKERHDEHQRRGRDHERDREYSRDRD
jgi:hypothetical protein